MNKLYIIIVVLSVFLFAGCLGGNNKKGHNNGEVPGKIKIFYETDMGNDIDDALALNMLYKYADEGLIEILGICSNKDNPYSVQYIDILNTWYGYPDIPVGRVVNGADDPAPVNYTEVMTNYEKDGKKLFKGSISNYNNLPEATKLYREILSKQPDNSVVLVSIGWFTNLARLLETEPDEYSDLNGMELIRKKISYMSVMACNFTHPDAPEYNIMFDIPAAAKVFEEWPTEIILSPFELGDAVHFPSSVIVNEMSADGESPLAEAYKCYRPMPYDNAVFDLTSVLYAVEGPEGYFEVSEKGRVVVDERGMQEFIPDNNGNVRLLTAEGNQLGNIKNRLVEIITTPSKNKNRR